MFLRWALVFSFIHLTSFVYGSPVPKIPESYDRSSATVRIETMMAAKRRFRLAYAHLSPEERTRLYQSSDPSPTAKRIEGVILHRFGFSFAKGITKNPMLTYDSRADLLYDIGVPPYEMTQAVHQTMKYLSTHDARLFATRPVNYIYELYEKLAGWRPVFTKEFRDQLKIEDTEMPVERSMFFSFEDEKSKLVIGLVALFDGTQHVGGSKDKSRFETVNSLDSAFNLDSFKTDSGFMTDFRLPVERKYPSLVLDGRHDGRPVLEIRRLGALEQNSFTMETMGMVLSGHLYHKHLGSIYERAILYVHTDDWGQDHFSKLGFEIEEHAELKPGEFILRMSMTQFWLRFPPAEGRAEFPRDHKYCYRSVSYGAKVIDPNYVDF